MVFPRQVGHYTNSKSLRAGHTFNHITIDGDRWDVKLFSSIVNQKFFRFAGVQAHVVVCCQLLNVIHGVLELVSAMRVAHFVQSDVIVMQTDLSMSLFQRCLKNVR